MGKQNIQNGRTGTFCGKAGFVILVSFLTKLWFDILHSIISTQKWSRTSKVNAVWGCFCVAGKMCSQNSCIAAGGGLEQHHATLCWKYPFTATKVIILAYVLESLLSPSESWSLNSSHSCSPVSPPLQDHPIQSMRQDMPYHHGPHGV